MPPKPDEIRIRLSSDERRAAQARAEKTGFDSLEEWVQALVEVELRRAELEAQVAQAIDQGDFQQLASDIRDKLRVAPKTPRPKSE